MNKNIFPFNVYFLGAERERKEYRSDCQMSSLASFEAIGWKDERLRIQKTTTAQTCVCVRVCAYGKRINADLDERLIISPEPSSSSSMTNRDCSLDTKTLTLVCCIVLFRWLLVLCEDVRPVHSEFGRIRP